MEKTCNWTRKAKQGAAYEIIRLLGEGSTGKVYLIKYEESGQEYALKVCKDINLLRKESAVLKSLASPLFPKWIDYWEEDRGFLVMEYIDGVTLEHAMQSGGKPELSQTIYIMDEILSALAYLHTRKPYIIFRDLKPENIIISTVSGNNIIAKAPWNNTMSRKQKNLSNKDKENDFVDQPCKVRIVDLGGIYEQISGEDRLSQEQSGKQNSCDKRYKVGSYGYAAPEQFWNNVKVGPECDLYAAGKIFAYLLTGKDPCEPPYDMISYCEENRDVTQEMFYVIQRSLSTDILGRYESVEAFRRDLYLAGMKCMRKKKRCYGQKHRILYKKCIWKSEYKRIF